MSHTKTPQAKRDWTPTPWKVESELGTTAIITDDDQELHLFTISGYSRTGEQDKANAAHIVRCVNSHEALVKALEEALQLMPIMIRRDWAGHALSNESQAERAMEDIRIQREQAQAIEATIRAAMAAAKEEP